MWNFQNLVGQRFGRLTVIEFAGYDNNGHHSMWLCQCDCGNMTKVLGCNLKKGNTTSCGCVHSEWAKKCFYRHGGGKTKLFRIWCNIKNRCYNKKVPAYKDYGGRGIKMCEEWKNDFVAFRDWAVKNGYDETAPKVKCSIDRIDNSGDYTPENCRWIDVYGQANNRRNNRLINYQNETYTMAQFCRMFNLPYGSCHYYYVYVGLTAEELIAKLSRNIEVKENG